MLRLRVLTAALTLLAALAPGLARAADGELLYGQNCEKCHGADGRADTPVGKAMKTASLVDAKWTGEDAAEALVTAFRANPKHKPVEGVVTDDDLRAIADHVSKLAASAR